MHDHTSHKLNNYHSLYKVQWELLIVTDKTFLSFSFLINGPSWILYLFSCSSLLRESSDDINPRPAPPRPVPPRLTKRYYIFDI